jgi:hydroxysqualene synthase
MTNASQMRSGKSSRDENFPVASWLVRPQHRAPILAFYEFVRTADDIADHAELTGAQKIALLDRLEADLLGDAEGDPCAVALKKVLAERNLSPRHALDLLRAFRLDAVKQRYADWGELMSYCELSAMPVGRFVLDVHGESRATWPSSDAVCAALQIINHLQDCGEDYRKLDRVYLPLDVLSARGVAVEALGARAASPALRECIAELARKTEALLRKGDALAPSIADWRLALEISVIQALAARLAGMLTQRDPLGEETHFGKFAAGGVALFAVAQAVMRRIAFRNRQPSPVSPP